LKAPTFLKKINISRKAQQKITVGLDIGQVAVRVLVLSPDKEKPTIVSFVSLPIEETPANTIRKAVGHLPAGGYRLSIGVSGPGVIIRYINLPKMTKEELRGAIQFEAEKHIPLPVAEVTLDSCILNEALPGNQMLVLLAAVKNDIIRQNLQLVHSAGAEIAVIDISTIAMINTFSFCQDKGLVNKEESDKSVALLDIGLKFSTLTIMENKIPRLSRDISAGTQVLDAANKDLVLANLADEIRRSFDFYESQSGKGLAAIFLSGEGALYPGIQDYLTQNVALPVKLWDPSAGCILGAAVNKEQLVSQAYVLPVALGLALR
jgi:type IV pilus assembly protein PilM